MMFQKSSSHPGEFRVVVNDQYFSYPSFHTFFTKTIDRRQSGRRSRFLKTEFHAERSTSAQRKIGRGDLNPAGFTGHWTLKQKSDFSPPFVSFDIKTT